MWKIRNTVNYNGKKYNRNQMLKLTLLSIKENLYLCLNSNLNESKTIRSDNLRLRVYVSQYSIKLI